MKRLVFVVVVVGCLAVTLPAVGVSWRARPSPSPHELIPDDPALFASGTAALASAASCSAATLTGRYGILWKGTSSTIGPGAAAGIVTFDGAGGIGGFGLASLNGGIIDRNWTGSYQMRSDCAGSATIVSNFGVSVSVVFIALNGGADLQFLETDSGTVMSGTARRLDPRSCADQTAEGTHVVSFTGIGTGGITGAALARFVFDGRGGLTGSGAASLDGLPVQRNFSGSYTVRPDCSGSATITSEFGISITVGFVLLDYGHAGYFVGLTPGMTLNGTAIRVTD